MSNLLKPKIKRHVLTDWLKELGLDPDDVRYIEITPEFLSIQILSLNDQGQPYLVDGELATESFNVDIEDESDQQEQV